MNAFDQIVAQISEPEGMTRCSPKQIAKMRQEYPSVADYYFELMAVVGWGKDERPLRRITATELQRRR